MGLTTAGSLAVGIPLVASSDVPLSEQMLSDTFQPNRFILFQKDGFVRFFCSRAEMGQGTPSGLRRMLAGRVVYSSPENPPRNQVA